MGVGRRQAMLGMAVLAGAAALDPRATAARGGPAPEAVLRNWYRLMLELVRHTPTYSPPVASRAFAYIGVTAYEATVAATGSLRSMAGQLTGLAPLPAPPSGVVLDPGDILHAALDSGMRHFFANTGPTGQRAMAAMARQIERQLGTQADAPGRLHGRAIAAHVQDWAATDGGAVVENMGFPHDYALAEGPAHWLPTSLVRQQQVPLLPGWGEVRPFAMPTAAACDIVPPPDYSEDPASDFYREALEVVEVTAALSPEEQRIARFWSDDPMLSPTPPGHWISLTLGILNRDGAAVEQSADVLMRVGVAVADAFIACWRSKYIHDLVRPVTYIRRVIDPGWTPILNTPPFPEYPSGHSTQSGAAATVLTHLFGENFAFEDATHVDDGLPARPFGSFWQAAEEAGISRLYGGIHFRAAIERGLEQGRCVGAHAIALDGRRT